MNNKKSVFNITVVVILLAVLGVAGYFLLGDKKGQSKKVNDIELARAALIEYYALLNTGQYAAAERYYGGEYDVLLDWNPNVAPDNHVALLKGTCEGPLRCLKVRSVLNERQTSPTEFTFTVQFAENDGTLFARGPFCCGANGEEVPTLTDFEDVVRKEGNEFRVMGLPVYVP